MSVIQKVAYFALCKSGKHGKIICADGTEGVPVTVKKDGYREIDRLFLEKKVDEFEVKFLREQVSSSQLPYDLKEGLGRVLREIGGMDENIGVVAIRLQQYVADTEHEDVEKPVPLH